MVDMDGVVNNVVPKPPDRTAPPEGALYQSIVSPALMDAESVTGPVPHRCPSTGVFGATGTAFTVAVTAVLVADIQPVAVVLVSA